MISILCGVKERRLSFAVAWATVMRAFSPPQEHHRLRSVTAPALDADRQLLREIRPFLQAAYEDREVTIPEFEKASDLTEKRFYSMLCAA